MRSILDNKKGMLGGLAGNIIAIVVAVIILVMGLVLVANLQETRVTGEDGCNATNTSLCGAAYDAAGDSLTGLATFADFVPLIVLAVAASIIIGLVLVGFAFGGRSR